MITSREQVEAYVTWRDRQMARVPAIAGEANAADVIEVKEVFPLEPFEDVVIIEPAVEEKRASGLILAGGAEKLTGGRVVASGPGRWYFAALNAAQTMESAIFVKNEVKVGDWVVFGKYQSGGEPIEYEGKKYLMARAGDLGGRSRSGEPIVLRRAIE